MPDFSNDFGGRYMNATHVTEPFVASVERVDREDVDGNGKMKPVCYFDGRERGIVLNASRYDALSSMAKSRDTDNWLGLRVQVRRGTTRFANKVVDCIEFGMPPKTAAQKSTEVTAELDDASPF